MPGSASRALSSLGSHGRMLEVGGGIQGVESLLGPILTGPHHFLGQGGHWQAAVSLFLFHLL